MDTNTWPQQQQQAQGQNTMQRRRGQEHESEGERDSLTAYYLWGIFAKKEEGVLERESYGERLGVHAHRLVLPPQVQQEVLQGQQVVQVADCRVHHQHHLREGRGPSHTHTRTVWVCGCVPACMWCAGNSPW